MKEAKTPFQTCTNQCNLESIVHQFASQKKVHGGAESLLAMNVAMGLLQLPQISDYWSKDKVFIDSLVSFYPHS